MGERLDVFLGARSLDEIAALARDVGDMSAEDEARVGEVLDACSDEQALANLLFEPSLMPRRRRVATILDHLTGDPDSYLALAAVVGAEQLGGDELVERQDAAIAAALVRYGRSVPFDELLELLDSEDVVVHHNVLAAIVAAVGLDRAAQLLRSRAAVEDADASVADDLAAVERALRLEGDDALVADVVLSRLSYIPDRG